jgi:hypothetical protein
MVTHLLLRVVDNLNSNVTDVNFTVDFNPPCAPESEASDNFNANAIDRNRWNRGIFSEAAFSYSPQIPMSQGDNPDPSLSGRLRIQPLNNVAGMRLGGGVSALPVDMTDQSIVSVKAERVAQGAGAVTMFSLGKDSNNFARISVINGPLSFLRVEQGIESPNTGETVMVFQNMVNGLMNSVVLPYQPAIQIYWRYRYDIVARILYFETTADPNGRSGWTIRFQAPREPTQIDFLVAELGAGSVEPGTYPDPAIFDEYNVTSVGVQFSQACYTVSEAAEAAYLTLVRPGDLNSTLFVQFNFDYGTAQNGDIGSFLYGPVSFAEGQDSVTLPFVYPVNDNIPEPVETVTITLINQDQLYPLYINTFAKPRKAVVHIVDDDGPPALEDPSFFVAQNYHDFLGRGGDASGLAYWAGQITSCGNNPQCVSERRSAVSAAFFSSPEFFDSGGYVYSLYKTTFGSRPNYQEFRGHRVRVVPGVDVEYRKFILANDWTLRTAFRRRYDRLGNVAFVNTLFANAGIVPNSTVRNSIINDLNAGVISRTYALYLIVGHVAADEGFRQYERNNMFVMMQYFGYLQRDPDQAGFDFWVNQLNSAGNINGMVCAFITSVEYQQRFGPVTRNNGECNY